MLNGGRVPEDKGVEGMLLLNSVITK